MYHIPTTVEKNHASERFSTLNDNYCCFSLNVDINNDSLNSYTDGGN